MQLNSRAVTRYRNDLSCRQPKQLWQTMNPIANYGTRSATDLKPGTTMLTKPSLELIAPTRSPKRNRAAPL